MSNKYESVIVFAPELDEQGLKGQLDRIESTVKAHRGEVEKQDIWGRRELGFRMKKRTFGIYVVLVYTGDNTLVAELDRQLRITETVLRHSTVRKDKYAADFSPERKEEGSYASPMAAPSAPEEEAGTNA